MRKLFWHDLTSPEFDGLDPDRTVVVLPVAATEQHGPHLTVAVDTAIADGLVAQTVARMPDDLSPLFLPTQYIGKSNEHLRSKGTLSLSAETALRVWTEIGEGVHRAGLRKLVFVNSHGGNVDLLSIVSRELRVRFGMLVVQAAWRRFGLPEGMFGAAEQAHGIHAGDIETSLMLHLRPDMVRADKCRNFVSSAQEAERRYVHLRPTGFSAYGWIAQDLNRDGAVGDASLASAEKGRLVADFEVAKFIELLRDVTAFPMTDLA